MKTVIHTIENNTRPITQNELMMLENTMTALRRAVSQMEEKLSK